YRVLARKALQFRGRKFWEFHKRELRALNDRERHQWTYLAMITGLELLWLLSNLGMTTMQAMRSLKQRLADSQFRLSRPRYIWKGNMKEPERKSKKIAFFGHFDSTNFGNESTLQAVLYHLRRFQPDAKIICICTGPEATAATYHIEAIPCVTPVAHPSSETSVKSWAHRNPVPRVIRRICIGLPNEAYRWIKCFITLRRTDMLIIPGTGLLTDAYSLFGWGPYNLLKWSLIGKVCRCKVLFVSVGAGPIYGMLGRCFVKAMLSLADFR